MACVAVADVTVHLLSLRDTDGLEPKLVPAIVKVEVAALADVTLGEELSRQLNGIELVVEIPLEVTTKSPQDSEQADVLQVISPGKTVNTVQLADPTATLVSSTLPLNPPPVILIV